MLEFLKQFFLPGSIPFLFTGLAVGVALLYLHPAAARWGRRWLTALLAFYGLISLPVTAGALESMLDMDSSPLRSAAEAEFAEVIVILGGGSVTYRANGREINELSGASSLRVLEGARLYDLLGHPWVIVSGGADSRYGSLSPETEAMVQELTGLGVASDRILVERQSGSTREQALFLQPMLEELGAARFALVTSPIHLRRALQSFRAQGMDPIPAASAQHTLGHVVERGGWIPHPDALSASQAALREVLALGYYRIRGWLVAPGGTDG